MPTCRKVLVSIVPFVLIGAAVAQQAPPPPSPPPMPKAEPVLSRVPAGALAYVVINNLQDLQGNIGAFIQQIGLQEMLPPALANNLAAAAAQQLQLGPGFNLNGGLAVAMLDPQPFGIDLVAMFKQAAAGGGPPKVPQLPVVLFLAGKSAQEVLGKFKPTPQGKYAAFNSPAGPLLAAKVGNYLAISQMPQALDAVAAAKKSAAAELGKEQAAIIQKADLAVRVNLKAAAPLLNKLLDEMDKLIAEQQKQMAAMQKQMAEAGAGPPPALAGMMQLQANLALKMMKMYRDMIGQIEGFTIAARLAKPALVLESLTDYVPGSMLGKAVASYKAPTASLVARLPDLPYVLAFGGAMPAEQPAEALQLVAEMTHFVLAALDDVGPKKLPADLKTKIKAIQSGIIGQIEAIRLVAGGAPEGSGLFGLAALVQCKDAAKMKALVGQSVDVANQLIQHFGADEDDVKALKVAYAAGAAAAAPDTIAITHPELAKMSDGDRAEMQKVLGEQAIRVRLAAADARNVLFAFGGGDKFFAEALQAAKGGGAIGEGPAMAVARLYLPKQPVAMFLLNPTNLLDVVKKGARTMNPQGGELPIPVKLTVKDPIILCSGVTGTSEHAVFYVPNKLIGEVAQSILAAMAMRKQPPPPPPMGGQDF